MSSVQVVVCGAGIAGLTVAARLAESGADVLLVEQANGPRSQGYMIDFFGPGYDAVEAMGLLPQVRELGYEVDEATYLNAAGKRTAGLSYSQFGRAVAGRLISIMRPDLELTLREHLPSAVDLRFGCTISALDNDSDGVRVSLSDGTELDADLVIGADGIHSAVRTMIFGAEREFIRPLGFHTAAYTFADDRVHREIGNRFCLTDTIGRQLGLYALRDGQVAVFAVHRTGDVELPASPRAALRETYGELGWVAPTALANCPPDRQVYYDLVAQVELPRWSTGRVVLIGDACGAVSLLAGQGASLGISGAYLLAHHLESAASVAQALAAYEREWRPVVAEKQRVARSGARWFLPETLARLRLRRVVMRMSTLPGVGRMIGTALAGKSTATIRQITRRAPTGP